jgi:hypothetical protein
MGMSGVLPPDMVAGILGQAPIQDAEIVDE